MNGDENDEDMEADEVISPNYGNEELREQRRPKPIRYDPNCHHQEIQFQLGMRLASYTRFKRAMQK